jgi:hypothetical protein
MSTGCDVRVPRRAGAGIGASDCCSSCRAAMEEERVRGSYTVETHIGSGEITASMIANSLDTNTLCRRCGLRDRSE